MLAWLRSPRGSISTATAVAVVLAALWFMQRAPLHDIGPHASGPSSAEPQQAASGTAGSPASAPGQSTQPPAANPPAKQTAAAGASPDDKAAPTAPSQGKQAAATGTSEPPVAAIVDQPKAAALVGSAQVLTLQRQAAIDPNAPPASLPPSLPTFDIVRVEPSGDAVVAGRAEPGSSVDLVDDGTVVAHVTVDGSGQFALLPPRLSEGSHYLTLQAGPAGAARVISAQSVAVSVAKNGTEKPLVALMSPDQPVRVLSGGAPAAPASQPAATANPNGPATPVAIQTVEAAQGGQFTASGVARAGSQCRLYLNGAFLADVTTGQDGRWSVRIEKGMRPGKYTVRADEIEASSGKVLNRAEVPFDYPAVAELGVGSKRMLVSRLGKPPLPPMPAPAAPEPAPPVVTPPQPAVAAATVRPAPTPPLANAAMALASSPDPRAVAAVVVPDLQTAKVIRGDSLWRISRKMLGHGVNYTEIYASNASQIRDPRLIYPGQIFVVPNHAVN